MILWSMDPGSDVIKNMLNSSEHGTSTAHKLKCCKNAVLVFKPSYVWFIILINVKMPTIVGILTFLSMIRFMLS